MWMTRQTLLPGAIGALVLFAVAAPAMADLIVNGDFESTPNGKALRIDNKGQDWRESRRDGKAGTQMLKLSTKSIAGNATKKAMIKANPDRNTYLTQRLAEPMNGDFTISYDICVHDILRDDNRSAFFMIGSSEDGKRGPNSTGTERFVFLGFENAADAGRINLFAREGRLGWSERTLIAADLELDHWYTIVVRVFTKAGEYEVTVEGVTEPVALEAFTAGKKPPRKLTHLSFASWNDGAGTFYVDNVHGHRD